jgi:ribosomal protein S18 acetylase RimI-like enzyme
MFLSHNFYSIAGGDVAVTESTLTRFVNGVHAAGNPYFDFIFEGDPLTTRVLRHWCLRTGSEVAWACSRLVVWDDTLVAGYTLLTTEDLSRRRRADLLALASVRDLPPAFAGRLRETSTLFTLPEPSMLYLSKLWVAPEYQGNGVGRALLAEIAQTAEAEGRTKVYVDVHAGNTAAIALYGKSGYRELTRHVAGDIVYVGMRYDPRVPHGAPR